MRIFFLSLTFVLFCAAFSSGQSSLNFTSNDVLYREGLQLLNEGKYLASMRSLEQYLNTGDDPQKIADAEYYIAFSALQLKNNDGEGLIEAFIEKYPTHSKAGLAYYELGNLKYNEKNYKLAIKYLKKVHYESLSKDLQYDAKFKLGYSYFTQKRFDKAYELFNELKREPNKYQYPASYYAGYINFEKGEYDRAYYDFERSAKNAAYAPVVPSMLVKVLYKQKRYDELIKYGQEALGKREVRDKQEINLYIGEAYFQKGDIDNAVHYYEDYLKAKKGNVDRSLLFRIAYVKMKTGDKTGAIESFKKVALKNDTLGFLSSYYLGVLYTQSGNKNYAIAAFKVAKDNRYDSDMEEEALFQYAKLNLDAANFDEAIRAIQEYKTKYPNSPRVSNIDEILTEAYLNSNDYDKALEHIENLSRRTPRINKAYQQIAFFKGVKLFNAGKFRDAVGMFDKSLRYPINNEFVIKAHFWKGEAYSAGGKFEEAVNAYAAVFRVDMQGRSKEYLEARYGIGYAYYNQKKYPEALEHFKYYTSHVQGKRENVKYRDALVRLGDCLYATKKYQKALEVFDNIITSYPRTADYAYLRKGVIFGLLGNIESANKNFDVLLNKYRNSRHYANALYQKGRLNFENGSYMYAIDLFTQLIDKFPESVYVPYAFQSRAIAATNVRKYPLAEKDYKIILEKYPSHEIAESALLGLQEVLQKTGKSNEFEKYMAMFRNANPKSDQLESIEFEAAKSKYFNQRYDEAIMSFERFLQQYPNSAMAAEARYLIADSYYRKKDYPQALENYFTVADIPGFARHNRVVQRIAELEYALGHLDKSTDYFGKLEKIAATKKEQFAAWNGLMKIYFESGEYNKAIEYANRILEKGQVAPNAKNEALLTIGKSYLQMGDKGKATGYFEKTLESARDKNGAEALYLIAKMLYDEGKYKESIDKLFLLNSTFPVYEYWLGKSFILIADNYLAMEEDFQAKATLESVVDNSPVEEIVDEAKVKLLTLEEKTKELEDAVLDTLEVEDTTENR